MNKRPSGAELLRRRRRRLWHEQGGLCHWCGDMTTLYEPVQKRRSMPPKMATLDHLDDRLSPERGKHRGKRRTVMACWQCNHERNVEAQRATPRAVLRERSQRHNMRGCTGGTESG